MSAIKSRSKLKIFYSYSSYNQPVTKAHFSVKLKHFTSIGNDKRLQAVALDKWPQFLKNLDILEELHLNKTFFLVRHLTFKSDKNLNLFQRIFSNYIFF